MYYETDLIEHVDLICDDCEIWKPAYGWEDRYEVSNFGNVRSKDWKVTTRRTVKGKFQEFSWISKGKVLKKNSIEGYPSVSLTRDGVSENVLIHMLVARTFLPNPNNYTVVNHIDTNKTNNHVSNLEWCTYEYNNIHAVYHGRNSQCIPVRCEETGKSYPSITRAEIDMHIPKGSISRIKVNNQYVYQKYHFTIV